MDRNLTISNTPITTCTQTTHHIHSVEELQQLRIALRRADRRGRQEFTCPMIRAWRRQFVDTYAVDATFTPTDASQSDKTELHRSRVLEADIQVSNVLVRWHCDGWPVATPRTAGETNLDGDALQPAPTPAPNDPNCFGYAHRVPAAMLPPTRKYDHLEGAQRRSTRNLSEQQNADQQSVDHWATDASTPSQWSYLPGVSQRVELDATPSHAADNSAGSRESNYEPGWYDERPATAFRHAPWVIELIVMKRDASESEPSLLDPDLLD